MTLANKPHGTTIVAVRRKGVIAIASDSQTTWGSMKLKVHQEPKVVRVEDDLIVGLSGSTGDCRVVLDAIDNCTYDIDKVARNMHELVLDDKGVVALLSAGSRIGILISNDCCLIETDEPVVGIGSAGEFADGAARALLYATSMNAAAIALKAVSMAAAMNIHTSGPIHVETVAVNAEDQA